MNRPIFIIAQHRTGSTLVQNMLGLNPDVAMAASEVHFSTPWHKDYLAYAKDTNNLKNDETLKNFMKLIFSGKLHGKFWTELKHTKIDLKNIHDRIYKSTRTPRDILSIIFEEYAISECKQRFAAKYPVPISKIKLLFEWWPNCKVIHLVRDPRAICASKVNDKKTRLRKKKFIFLSPIVHFATEFLFVIDFIRSSNIHLKYKHQRNYLTIKFEDILNNPIYHVKTICDFCEIDFAKEMLHPTGKESSHDGRKRIGFDNSVANHWETKLSLFEKKWITFVTKKSMKKLGYLN